MYECTRPIQCRILKVSAAIPIEFSQTRHHHVQWNSLKGGGKIPFIYQLLNASKFLGRRLHRKLPSIRKSSNDSSLQKLCRMEHPSAKACQDLYHKRVQSPWVYIGWKIASNFYLGWNHNSLVYFSCKPWWVYYCRCDFNQRRKNFLNLASKVGLSQILNEGTITHKKGNYLDDIYTNLKFCNFDLVTGISYHSGIIVNLEVRLKQNQRISISGEYFKPI